MRPGFKKLLLTTGAIFLLLVIVLGVHIYLVTRPKVPDATTRAMARIDFKQDISDGDAATIYSWLMHQKGIERVMFNVNNKNVVFTFSPLIIDAEKITRDIQNNLHYKALRYVPGAEDMKKGCPVSQTSVSYRMYSVIKNIF
jgi:thiosulfate reductase cytochrome b subunit